MRDPLHHVFPESDRRFLIGIRALISELLLVAAEPLLDPAKVDAAVTRELMEEHGMAASGSTVSFSFSKEMPSLFDPWNHMRSCGIAITCMMGRRKACSKTAPHMCTKARP